MSQEGPRVYPELNLGRNSRCNSGRLWREQQAGKAWLGAHLDCITPIRFSIGNTDKEATECGGFISNQLTIFSSRVQLQCVKVDTLGRLCDNNLKRAYSPFNYKHNLFYLKLHIIFSFISYLKSLLQLSPLEPLVYNQELVPHIIVFPGIQFHFVLFQQL